MPSRCFVYGCNSGYSNNANKDKSWHFFAPPKKNPELFRKWQHMCFRRDKKMTSNSRICHEHFKDEHIIKCKTIQLQDGSNYTYYYSQWKLTEDAYPTIFDNTNVPSRLWKKTKTARKPPLDRSQLPEKRKRSEEQDLVLHADTSSLPSFTSHASESTDSIQSCSFVVTSCYPSNAILNSNLVDCHVTSVSTQTDFDTNHDCHTDVRSVSVQTDAVKNHYKTLYYKWYKKCHRIQQTLKHKATKRAGIFIPYENLNIREKMYANSLARKANTKKLSGMRYTSRHLIEAAVLSCKGRKTYNYIRSSSLQVLPSLRSVRKLRAATTKTGLNSEALSIMSKTVKNIDPFMMIKFDEVYLNTGLKVGNLASSFKIEGIDDSKKDINKRLQNRSMVIMADCIKSKNSFTVANYPSSGGLSGLEIANKIQEAIAAVEAHGGKVLGVVSDGAASNKNGYKHLGIKIENDVVHNSIKNPNDPSRQVFFLHDAPHLIKCIRNHFLNPDAVHLFKGKPVSSRYLHDLYALDMKNPLHRVCPKLTPDHLKPEESYLKMKVSLATQLFSNSVAAGIKFYREQGKKEMKGSEQTESFVKFINDLFDALNGTNPSNAVHDHGGLLDILTNAYRILFTSSSPCVIAANTTTNSLRLTIKSTIDICLFLLRQQKYKYVLTSRLNQDSVELRFSTVRGFSPNDHPDVSQFADINAIQAFSGSLRHVLSEKSNVHPQSMITEENATEYCEHIVAELKRKYRQNKIDAEKRSNEMKKAIIERTIFLEDCGVTLEPEQTNVDFISCFNNKDYITYYMVGYTIKTVEKQINCAACISKCYADQQYTQNIPVSFLNMKEFRKYKFKHE